LFEIAKNNIENSSADTNKFNTLLKIFKKDKVLNIIDTG